MYRYLPVAGRLTDCIDECYIIHIIKSPDFFHEVFNFIGLLGRLRDDSQFTVARVLNLDKVVLAIDDLMIIQIPYDSFNFHMVFLPDHNRKIALCH